MAADAAGGHHDVLAALGKRARFRIGNRVQLQRRVGLRLAERLRRHEVERRNQVEEEQEADDCYDKQNADGPLDGAADVHTPPPDPALPGYAMSGRSLCRISS